VAGVLRFAALAVAAALVIPHSVAGESSAAEQLERMATALRSLSYQGTLVYLHGNRLETLHIERRIENGEAQERLVSLNGPVRTLTREHDRVTCELPDSLPISIYRRGLAQGMLRSKSVDLDTLARHYLVHPLGLARVAGRQTEVVGIIPRDNLRYGYRFYLDSESGLPLKSDLMGEEAEPIEQIMFTSLDLLPSPGAAVASAPGEGEEKPRSPADRPEDTGEWRFSGVPPGFVIVMHDQLHDQSDHPVEHFVLSDGLASLSVYLERDAAEGLEGVTRIGAVHAAGGRVSGYQVTVVGEVPAKAVEAVLAGISRDGGERP
jgi:sigma-E factor negative regulatory protein RseB